MKKVDKETLHLVYDNKDVLGQTFSVYFLGKLICIHVLFYLHLLAKEYRKYHKYGECTYFTEYAYSNFLLLVWFEYEISL